MSMPINPDIEVLHVTPLTPRQQIKAFEDAVANYAMSSAVLRAVSVEISQTGWPRPDPMRVRLQQAACEENDARRTVLARAKILLASGLLERCAEALEHSVSGQV